MRKGITAISVAIIVVVMFILMGTITVTSYNSVQNSKKLVFALEISDIQEQVDKYVKGSEEGQYPANEITYTIDLSQITSESLVQFDGETKDQNNVITVYGIDLSEIGIKNTTYGNLENEKDVYVLSVETGRVYYLDGIKSGSKTYYTLTQDLINIKERNEKVDTDDSTSPVITTTAFSVNRDESGASEIYLSNIKVSGEDVTKIKYERAYIEETDAYEYFKNGGNTLSSDRLKVQEGEYITIYAEDNSGNWTVRHEGIPKIPDDFYYVGGSIPTGVVISDNVLDANKGTAADGDVVSDGLSGNQFVWVPVVDISNFVRRDGYANGSEQTQIANGLTSEPYNGLSLTNDLTGEWAEYTAMKASVEKNKGFYIARYEAGDGETTVPRTTSTVAHKVVSKKNSHVYNYVPWGASMTSIADCMIDGVGIPGAVTLSRNMYISSQSVVSTLCYSVQWDAILYFMKDIENPNVITNKYYIYNSTGMGWHINNYESGNPNHLTGVDMENIANKVNNIYDIGGNVFELTMENINNNGNNYRGYRGGCYNYSGAGFPPSYREISGAAARVSTLGFRVALYLK